MTRFNNHYSKHFSKGTASVISELTRQFAKQICDLHAIEAALEIRLIELLEFEGFLKYHKILEEAFKFGPRERGWILSRIFPFDSFLLLPRKKALRRFRQACGLGKIEKSSGKVKAGSGRGKWTGCNNTRSTLWTYIRRTIEPKKQCKSHSSVQRELREFYVRRAFNTDGTKKKGRQLADARNATSRKLADLIFRELWRGLK